MIKKLDDEMKIEGSQFYDGNRFLEPGTEIPARPNIANRSLLLEYAHSFIS